MIGAFAAELGPGAGGGVLVCARGTGSRGAAIAAARRRLGLPDRPVGRDALGAPLWPAQERGSLSHWRDFSLCLLVPGTAFDPGVDIEGVADAETRAAIRAEALLPVETRLLEAARLPEGMAEALAFSAKESFFKAAYPRIGHRIGFEAAEIHAPPGPDGIALRIPRGLGPGLPAGLVLELGVRLFDAAALTWLLLPAPGLSPRDRRS